MARILVIDDEQRFLAAVRRMLRREGYEVVVALDGKEGLELQQKKPADLVITDILMPGKEGIETIVELRQAHPGVKVIAISGGGKVPRSDCLTLARAVGATATLSKPFARKSLLDTVSRLLAQQNAA